MPAVKVERVVLEMVMAVMLVMQLEYAEVEPLERAQVQHEWEVPVAAAAAEVVVVLVDLVVQVAGQLVLRVPVEVPRLLAVVVLVVEFPSLVQVQF